MAVDNYNMRLSIRDDGRGVSGTITFDPEYDVSHYMYVAIKSNGDLGLEAGIITTGTKISIHFKDVDGETFEAFLNALLSRANGAREDSSDEFVVTRVRPDMRITKISLTSEFSKRHGRLHTMTIRQDNKSIIYILTDNQLAGLGYLLTIMGDYYWSRRVQT